jgi:uncharacterized OB-fold protein
MIRKPAPRQAGPASPPLAKSAWPDREVCPKCGHPTARVFGRSESLPIVYLRCDDCGRTTVARA